MSAIGQTIPVSQLTPAANRAVYIKNKRGDYVGANWVVPDGDFGRFLGWKKPTNKELAGDASGSRAIEVAIHREMEKLGKGAAKNGEAYRNLFIANGRFENEPGRERDMIISGLDSVEQGLELGHEMGMRYLEMQYKFELIGKNFGSISNLMRVRNESIKKSINEVR